MKTRRLYLAWLVAIPMLFAAWNSAFSTPCLMSNPAMVDDCCDRFALCTPECGATCQPSFTVQRVEIPPLVLARQSSVVAVAQTLTGIEIAPELPPPRL